MQAWKHFQQRRVEELFDPNLQNIEKSADEIRRVVHVGLLCTQEISSLRPSMWRAVEMLVRKEEELAAPTTPPFMDDYTMELNNTTAHPSSPNASSLATISQSIFYPR